MTENKVWLTINNTRKCVGEIEGKKFFTRRDESKHFFRLFNALGIGKDLLEKLIDRDIEEIIIKYNVKGVTRDLKTTPTMWRHEGLKYHATNFEEQIFLPIELFEGG